jgi:hypothetical protein
MTSNNDDIERAFRGNLGRRQLMGEVDKAIETGPFKWWRERFACH